VKMGWNDLLLRVRAIARLQRSENELDEELSFHVAMEKRRNRAAGMSETESQQIARARFGGLDQIKEQCRDARGVSLIVNTARDVQFAARLLAKNRGFTLVAVLTLSLGIGANTAIFSAVTGILLRPLPYQDADRLVMLWEENPSHGWYHNIVSAANFTDWRSRNHVFSDMAAFTSVTYNLTGYGEPVEVSGEQVTPNLFALLGISPVLGRTFSAAEEQANGPRTVLLSHGFWQSRYGADKNVVGRLVGMNGEGHTIIGVLPEAFTGCDGCLESRNPDVWTSGLDVRPRARTEHALRVIARLKPKVSLRSAQSEMDAIGRTIEKEFPANKGWGVQLAGVREDSVRVVRPAILVLAGAVILILLIACVNLANLLLARGANREREIAIRLAMGAGRRRVIAQLLTESALLAVIGGAIGLVVAYGGTVFLKAYGPTAVTPALDNVSLNLPVLLYALGLTCATGLLFGLGPAIMVTRLDLNSGLRQSGRGSTEGRGVHGLRNFLVSAEFALSIILAIAAALMIRSFAMVSRVPLGIDARNVVTMRVPLRSTRYKDPLRVSQFFAQLLPRMEAIPGVVGASVSRGVPIEGWAGMNFVTDRNPNPPQGEEPSANYVVVSPHYFEVMRIPLRKGRPFSEHDTQSSPQAAIVNEELARQFWQGEQPIGRRLRMRAGATSSPWLTVVGVARNVITQGPQALAQPEIYVSYTQLPWVLVPRHLVVRLAPAANRGAILSDIRKEVAGIDPDQPVSEVRPLDEIVHQPIEIQQFLTYLLFGFGALALLLASLGVYGVLSYSVAQRTHEIGIRMALGADGGEVLRQVVYRGMRMALVGLCTGVIGALALTQYLESLLFEVKPRDPFIFAAVPLLLLVIAAAASYLPARRAAKVDPMVALRFG
jgi:predicted permease